eukprot:scaffold132073_cov20-Tisochrysis_lutea.AAC.3
MWDCDRVECDHGEGVGGWWEDGGCDYGEDVIVGCKVVITAHASMCSPIHLPAGCQASPAQAACGCVQSILLQAAMPVLLKQRAAVFNLPCCNLPS